MANKRFGTPLYTKLLAGKLKHRQKVLIFDLACLPVENPEIYSVGRQCDFAGQLVIAS
jgi:hypothetical protein